MSLRQRVTVPRLRIRSPNVAHVTLVFDRFSYRTEPGTPSLLGI